MAWSDALEVCRQFPIQPKQHAYEMSYGYFDGGPAWMASLASELREEVARLDASDELPEPLAKMCFAWKNATYMARNRHLSKLPGSWRRDAPMNADELPQSVNVSLWES